MFKKSRTGLVALFLGFCMLNAQQAKVAPSEDFYTYVNQEWINATQIPDEYGSWGSFHEVFQNNQNYLKEILSQLQADNLDPAKGSDRQLVKDFYNSGKDTMALEQLGKKPLLPYLAEIDSVKSIEDYLTLLPKFYAKGIQAPFGVWASPDEKKSTVYALYIAQSGLGMANRAYYLEDNDNYINIRKEYEAHIAKMFQLAGLNADKESEKAKKIVEMETLMARVHRTPVQGRDSERSYNKKTFAELENMTFNINWPSYFKALGIENDVEYVIVQEPEFVAVIDRMLGDYTLEDWKNYSRWKLLQSTGYYLSKDFRDQQFHFYQTVFYGTPKQQPRWKTVLGAVNGNIGQPLGKLYVEKHFPKRNKEKMLDLVADLKEALSTRIDGYDWMSEPTKKAAKFKLEKMGIKMGYPDQWLDYSNLEIRPNDYFGNIIRSDAFNFHREINRIGGPIDPNYWGMTPPTVNAYYSPTRNEIVFPAGILNPPFFDYEADDATNFGSAGVVIGHEISHGFDDNGSLYDADGNLKSWWTKEDREKFEERAKKIEEQFDTYKVLDSIHLNGKLTLGENIGDLGGMAIAFEAMKLNQKRKGPKIINGLTDEQRFFIAYAKMWRIKFRDNVLANQVKTDPHSPGEFRTNGTLSNFEEFFKAFDIKKGSKMRREEIVEIW
ncbi:M13 family metallopeptidase [Flagellimonas meishanensis]|uniref:M13 family metallopeptidase n=1 Tax=Flagellimonas meishanensis TaxID=2873264 RepID=UPI001CA6D31E|nr:M13 family metallopeptidase [[Muricauda] meishanensis]